MMLNVYHYSNKHPKSFSRKPNHPYHNKKTPHKKKVRTTLVANNFTFDYVYNILRFVGKFVIQFNIKFAAKDPILTEFDVDLHDKIPFQKSHLFLLQIIEWLINTAAYARESPAVQRMAVSALNYSRSMHWVRPLVRVA